MNIYDTADRAIHAINSQSMRTFNQLKTANWDELNVIGRVKAVYRSVIRYAKRCYRDVARDAYMRALIETGMDRARARRLAEIEIEDDFLDDLLLEANSLTLYVFENEAERKRDRFIEAVQAAHDRNAEIDRALRYWSFQAGQYVDIAVAMARHRAFEDADVAQVRWVTQRDERVCEECGPLDGRVFRIDEAPNCPLHYRCRCYLIPVRLNP